MTGVLPRVAADSYSGRSAIAFPAGRLTVAAGEPVTVSDWAAQPDVLYIAYRGNLIPVFDGTNYINEDFTQSGGLDLALDTNAAHTLYHADGNYDLFVFVDTTTSDVRTIRLGSAAKWSSATARAATGSGFTGGSAVALGQTGGPESAFANGVYLNTEADVQLRFGNGANDLFTVNQYMATWVGTMRVLSGGVLESARQRHLWNTYNRVPRRLFRKDTTNTWNYSTAAFQQANASTTNQVEVVRGLDDDQVDLNALSMATSSGATLRTGYTAIGLDATNARAADSLNGFGQLSNGAVFPMAASYVGHPGIGYHFLAWLEYGGGADTQTWFGDNGAALMQTGMTGWCMA